MGTVLRQCRRLLLFDGRGASALAQKFFDRFQFEQTFHQPGALRAFLRERLNSDFRVLYQPMLNPPNWTDGKDVAYTPQLAAHFNAVTYLAIRCGRLIYAIDEMDRFTSASWAPAGLSYLVNQGRHVQVSMVCTARRPQQIPREFTSQAHRFEIFRMTEPRDLSYLEDYVGRSATAKLPNLAPYSFLGWEETEGLSITDRHGRSKTF